MWVTEAGNVGLTIVRDASDAKQLPSVIRTTLERFFRSKEGMNLGWAPAQIERAIDSCAKSASEAEITSDTIQSSLKVAWTIDLRAVFVEHVKVIYEVCCEQFGDAFLELAAGQELRGFLLEQCQQPRSDWDLHETANRLGVAPAIPPELDRLLSFLTGGGTHSHHVALVIPTCVVCSMFGMGAAFYAEALADLPAGDIGKVYLNPVSGGRCGVFDLGELLQA